MKKLSVKLLSLLLAGLMLLSCFVACGENAETEETQGEAATKGDAADTSTGTMSVEEIAQAALAELGDIDFGGERFAILHDAGFESEIWGENKTIDKDGGSDQVINDAVYERNVLLEEHCKLEFDHVASSDVATDVMNESATATGDFYLIDARTASSSSFASSGYLYDYVSLDIDLDQPWWDGGTADFALNGKVFFMNGAVNFFDDNVTYVLIFNKKLQQQYANTVPNPYETVLNWEWTLDYFNTVIQGIKDDVNGDGKYDEHDKYGFVTTWEYGNTFFIGSDLRYILNDRDSDEPSLFLSDSSKMEKALDVLDTAYSIYHDNNATYMSPGGSEALGLSIFKEDRGLFYGEVASYLKELNRTMDTDFGVLPVPKYDKAQEFYRTWTHESGSSLSITSAVKDNMAETVGDILEAYAILSYQKVKPAYYDITLASKTVRDPQDPVMLDIIFQNRIYDMAFYYYNTFGNYYDLFKTAVNENKESFSSSYTSVSKSFDRNLKKFLRSLGD